MAEGAPGNPGIHVLKAATSENDPWPQELRPHTLNLYAFPGSSSTRCVLGLFSDYKGQENIDTCTRT